MDDVSSQTVGIKARLYGICICNVCRFSAGYLHYSYNSCWTLRLWKERGSLSLSVGTAGVECGAVGRS